MSNSTEVGMRSNFPVVLALLSTVTSSLLVAPSIAAQSAVDAERIAANDNRRPAGWLTGGVLTVRLEVRPGLLQPEESDGPAVPALAFAEVGRRLQVPGPLIRVPQGTEIRVSLRNPFRDSTLSVYGLHAHPVEHDTALRIPGGQTREVRFRGDTPGTYYYWGTTSANSLVRQWFESQLTGALVVDAPKASMNDRVFVIGIWNRPGDSSLAVPRPAQEVMVINGKSWPHTELLTYARGDSVRWRWINATGVAHPMHLHGFYFHLESRGDWQSEREFRRNERPFLNTNLMLPGETMRTGWVPEREGNWLFHCHFAFHVSQHLALLRGEPGTPAPQPPAIATAGLPSDPHAGHAPGAGPHPMAGLVLGIRVGSGPSPRAGPGTVMPARNIRLIAQSAPKRFGSLTGLGYVVAEGTAEPPRDSVAIPGPTLVLRRGEPVRITVVNRIAEPTAVHWHGIELESFPDGVPGWSGTPGRIMPPIAPGDSFVAEFVPPRAGTFIYHTHSNEQLQLGSGLYGALLVVEAEKPYDPDTDKVILVGGAGPADSLPQFGFESPGLVNGSLAPSPIDLSLGRTYRLRLININPDWRVIFSLMSDSALASWRPIAVDGADLPLSQRRERPAYLLTGPGQTADFEFTPTARGELRLEVKTQLPGWIIPIVVRVR
jgi:FtsP/CotA-like multicopper oxidase with cupredoxin domain